ncbi:hypothetical protein SETIT_5G106900v2 [Setaria italica]|uniref:Receptor kinase-like protein Xa21 n=1 Tax=Setaria italica TaxID=4555 RepID=K3XE35_SETIT|nr:probable LRR receptor-like serine/threonine-protein kinase At3g47570 [Setaria italica]RCV24704.1 hypothetical protein SETIT_5G106900v2 [Setaria italica]
MAMGSLSLLLLLLISTASADDEAALLAFKAAAIGGNRYGDPLALWNKSSAGGYCSWEGVRCQQRQVVELSLTSRGLEGVLSPAIGNLSSLRVLNLSNNAFHKDIPASLGRLRHLHTVDLSSNVFSGKIPANLSSCPNLTTLLFYSNQLSGSVPFELGDKLTRLKNLIVYKNNLIGGIPASLANLSSLLVLSLSFNQLEGTIPPGLGGILSLRHLDLAFNRLSGDPPASLYNLSSLEMLQIQGNMLRGSIPVDIGKRFPSMLILRLATNQFTGSIPASLSNLTTLKELELQENGLSGHVPSTMGKLQGLRRLNLQHTNLEADNKEGWEFMTSLSNCSQLQHLLIGSNTAFTGQIPSSIGNLSTTLRTLMLADTGISGTIPSSIGNLVNLEYLHMANNTIYGVIPESIGKLGNLVMLALYNTDLSGFIPPSIGNLTRLISLNAYSGNLEGPIPASLGKLKNLVALDLSMNRLNGSIPIEIFRLPLLSRYLAFVYNSLSGPLPSEVGRLRNLNALALTGNQLSGTIPDSIGECTVLQSLWLDNNSFEGSIPPSVRNLKGLTTLDLSMNKLSGIIPDAIGSISNLQVLFLADNNLSGPIPTLLQNVTSLIALNLSFNNLQGEVPKEGIFRYVANFSITGNSELCGGIPQLNLAPCSTISVKNNRKGRLQSLKIAMPIIGALLLLGIIIVLFHLTNKTRRRQKRPFLSPITEKQNERVSYQALANGTDGFSEANLLGKGSFGAVYKCTFQDEGTIVAVKVFNLEQSGSTRSFVAECEALSRARHRCLIKIITCCSSINHQGQEFKALVFEFMPNGSLNAWLNPNSDMPNLTNTLSLEQRLDIAVDVMDALDYLHNHCQTPIVHCDLKPSNILLAEDMSARVGDFGISRILPESASRTLQNSNSTIGIRGSIGYVAPEYGEGSAISTIGDVYSLGILLLEMFTGRSPTDDMFREVDLHQYSKQGLSERILDIADSTIWLHVESKDSIIRSTIKNCLVSVFRLAISCSKRNPRDRMMMKDAVVEMHAIRDSYHKFSC